MRSRSILLALILAAVVHAPLAGQVRADPGTVINGRVAVRVYVVLSDAETQYEAIRGVQLRFFPTTIDTAVVVRTDDAGAATALLEPGEYRLVSSSPVNWKGTRYSWDRLVQVKPGIAAIELGAGSAQRSEVVDEAASAAIGAPPATRVADATLVRKDPGMATLYSFFAPGSGHLYAEERTTGAVLLGLSVVGLGVTVSSLSCAADTDCDATTGRMTLGVAGMLALFGSWAYGMFDADDAARRFNASHGLTTAHVRPIVVPGARGQTQLGFSVGGR
ncbi:MAG TPA: hypothetical protein VFZ21_26925 [Gemmatimonadaceae bacterium]|jgi:hypothetical protein|nr:hypothetical protein [Gemmatimonadaceae bacterium]